MAADKKAGPILKAKGVSPPISPKRFQYSVHVRQTDEIHYERPLCEWIGTHLQTTGITKKLYQEATEHSGSEAISLVPVAEASLASESETEDAHIDCIAA